MSKKGKGSARGTMLELWRPPQDAGDAVGCLATTYTFAPGLFDEQCLARFLEIESEPDREDFAFLLERETRLGAIYAGILVDHTRAGVAHSLRWDVLPVRIPGGKQHAKLSLLVWTRHVRIIVASANLTEQGYRINLEVAASVDLTPAEANLPLLTEAVGLLRRLVTLVPGASSRPPEVERAEGFLDQVERHVRDWKPARKGGTVRQQLVGTFPAGPGVEARSSLEEAVSACRTRGTSPREVWVASPFYDEDDGAGRVTAALCKSMARGDRRDLWFAVPALREEGKAAAARLAAPRALLKTPAAYGGAVSFQILPEVDEDKNRRPWHAKMLVLRAENYAALLVGSSNFTCAGMGVRGHRNAEANLLTIADEADYAREAGKLEAVWPEAEMESVADPEAAEWAGPHAGDEEEEQPAAAVPSGFLSATYCAGDERRILLRLDPAHLPGEWTVLASGTAASEIASTAVWREAGRPVLLERPWKPVQPPEKLLVRWEGGEAFMPLNVEEARVLPAPAALEQMSADDMLLILAASDPSAAFRAWARRQRGADADDDLDSATPIDLDPLRRYDLKATFLHRIRRRAAVLAQLRANLQRPVWSRQALEWRLRGLVGVEALGERLVRELEGANGSVDEALLTLADFLIVLGEVKYEPDEGAVSAAEFSGVYTPFLAELGDAFRSRVESHRGRLSQDLTEFWDRVVERCRR